MIIVHALPKAEWEAAEKNFLYGGESLQKYGFIHCSSIENIPLVGNNYFKGVRGLVLLCIDTDKVKAEIRWEDSLHAGKFYPHIYGLLNRDAVVDVIPFEPDEEGNFSFTPELERIKEL